MEFDLAWLLLGVPLVFALGWWASRMDWRQLSLESRQAPRAYFKGLNYLLNEQQDQAIDAFIEAVQKDPDTSELHFALGGLFRRRGEFDRAIRVHEHLLARADLSRAERERAQHALALDFFKAGIYDRAEAAYARLEHTAHARQAALGRLLIAERCHHWPQAIALSRQMLERAPEPVAPAPEAEPPPEDAAAIAPLPPAALRAHLAHYLCEQAAAIAADATDADRLALLDEAIATAPEAARPRIERARLLAARGQHASALAALAALPAHAPQALPLVAVEMVELAARCHELPAVQTLLAQSSEAAPSLDLTEAQAQAARLLAAETAQPAENAARQARQIYARHLARSPSLNAAARWLEHLPASDESDDNPRPTIGPAMQRAARALACYRCAACGFTAKTHFWQCPGCQSWDSMPPRRVEEIDP